MHNQPLNVDVRTFEALSSIDTCAVWNVLSSQTLMRAILRCQRHFILVDYVRYECLVRRRTMPTLHDLRLQGVLRDELTRARWFAAASLDVSDLREVARLNSIRQLGKGEIAAMALARKIRAGYLTDDRGAFRLAREALPEIPSQTTPQLVGWLVYKGELNDSEYSIVAREHSECRGRSNLEKWFEVTYHEGLRCRLMNNLSQ